MAVKPGARQIAILEQIIEDEVSGLILQFEANEDGSARLRIVGACLPFGNREVIFDRDGAEAGGGTHIGDSPRPSWLRRLD